MKLISRLSRRLLSLSFSTSSSEAPKVSGLAAGWLATEKPAIWHRKKDYKVSLATEKSGIRHRKKRYNDSLATEKSEILNPEDHSDTLYRRIWAASAEASITPLLDGWASEGRDLSRNGLVSTLKGLRSFRRYKHALEVSLWMSNKRFLALSTGEVAIQLDLISKVHGSELAEKHFNELPKTSRNHQTYGALLNCYAHEMLVDKAERLFLEMRDFGFTKTTLCYGVMSNLYYQSGNRMKLDNLVQEMERDGIVLDTVLYSILVSAYGRESDIDGIKKIIAKAESDHKYDLESPFYLAVANSYFKSGLLDKGVESLRKAEKLINFEQKKDKALNYLLTLYAAAGRKDEVWRIWKCKKHKVYNRDYVCMISSLLSLNDLEGAEQILEEWESTDLSRDPHIPDCLIRRYCREGLLEKAESIVNRFESKGGQPNSFTRSHLSQAYIQKKQMPQAVEAIKSAVLTNTLKWKPTVESLAACLNYLIVEKDMESFEELTGLLRSKGFISEELHHKLLTLALDGDQVEDVLKEEFASGSRELPEENISKAMRGEQELEFV